MIIESIASTLRNIPLPSFPSAWKGRQVTILTLGALSLGLIAFLIKKVFWSPATEAPKIAESENLASPKEKQKTSVSMFGAPTPARTSLHNAFGGSVFQNQETPGRLEMHKVFTSSFIPPNRFPILIHWTNFPLDMSELPNPKSKDFKQFFSENSLFFIGNEEFNLEHLLEGLLDTGWDQTVSLDIVDFLARLNEIGKQSIKKLYNGDFLENDVLIHGPIHASLSKKNEQVKITLNNLLYFEDNFLYQLYLNSEKTKTGWEVKVSCTTWTIKPSHPLTLSPVLENWRPVIENAPLSEGHICLKLLPIESFVIQPNLGSDHGVLAPLFDAKDLLEICGEDLENLEQLKDQRLWLPAISDQLSGGEDLEVLQGNLKPRIFKQDKKIYAQLFLKLAESDSNILEVGLSISINKSDNWFGKKKLLSVKINEGFCVEWMRLDDDVHPLVKYVCDDQDNTLNKGERTGRLSSARRLNFSDYRT